MAQPYSQMPPQRPPPQPPYRPPQSSPSPAVDSPGGLALPPNKRPRLSPNPPNNPPSPYANSSTVPYLSLPTTPSGQHQPFNTPQPLNASNEMASRGVPGSMGPPQLPVKKEERVDKSTDINDLSDIISAAGIDVREEENYLLETYRNQHQNSSFTTSFSSQSSSTLSPNNSFTSWPQGNYAGHPAFQGAGPFSQPPVPQKTVEQDLYEKHKRAARALSEHRQLHLNDPFLLGDTVRRRLHQRCYENNVRLNVEGLFEKIPEKPVQVNGVTAVDSDGTGIVSASAQAPSVLNDNTPLADIISLISLATNERLRSLLEDAFALSRGRQIGSHGVVPPEWQPLAVGNGAAEPATAISLSISKTAWDQPDSAISPMTMVPAKRPHEASVNRLPTPPTDTPPTPQPTIQYPNQLATSLRSLSREDRKAEEARLALRAKRQRAATAQAASTDSPATPGTPAQDQKVPEIRISKKERDRLAKAGQTDEVLHKAANATASMALAAFGGARKKYSWMESASGGPPGRNSIGTGAGIQTPSRLNTSVGSAGEVDGAAGGGGAGQDKNLISKDRRWGEWREDGPRGKAVQIRDLIGALEQDGKNKKALVGALTRLRSTEI